MGMVMSVLRVDPSEIDGLDVDDLDEAEQVDLDKLWDAVARVLAPVTDLLDGDRSLDALAEDLDHVPAVLDPGTVARVVEHLDAVLAADPVAAVERVVGAEVYPDIWDEDGAIGEVVAVLGELRDFLRPAVAAGQAAVTYLT